MSMSLTTSIDWYPFPEGNFHVKLGQRYIMETTHTRRLGGSPSSSKVTVPFYVPPPSVKKTSTEIINEARASIKKGGAMGISVSPSEMGMAISPSVRPLDTKRPFTPRERQRTLFGTSNNYSRRPPSSFSLGYLQFQETDLGNSTSPNLRRLNPLPFSPSSSLNSSLNSSLSSSGSSAEQSSWRAMVSGDVLDISDNLPSSSIRKDRAGSATVQTSKYLPCFDGSPPKLRLPAIGSGAHLITRRNQFRATASLDNLPEEVEGEDCESQDNINIDSSAREPPPMRKAYSSPIQRTYTRDIDLDKDIFGPLETCDLQSPTSNKRSLTFDHENTVNSSKKEQKHNGVSKKYKGDAWGPTQEKNPVSKVNKKFSNTMDNDKSFKHKEALEIQEVVVKNNESSSSNSEQFMKAFPVENKSDSSSTVEMHLTDLKDENNVSTVNTRNRVIKQSNDVQMNEDLSEIHAKATKKTKQSKENGLHSGKEIKTEKISPCKNYMPETFLQSSSSTPINILKKHDAEVIKKYNSSEIIESSIMLQNLGVNDSASLPASPDIQYLASAKEALLADSQEINNIQSYVPSDIHKKVSTTVLSGEPTIKSDNFRSPKPLVADSKSVIHDHVRVSETNLFLEDPILGPIQQAMMDTFSPKDTVNKMQDVPLQQKCSRTKSGRKSSELTIKSDTVRMALETLTELAKQDGNDIEVILALSKLYKILESENAFGLNTKNSKLKSQVLKVVYKFVERSNETLLLQIARIILAFRVNGSNLSGVCKLVFKVSRCDKNDRLFLEDNILELFVEALGSASPLEDAEACVYGYGALKFLTMNNVVLSAVLGFGILELMVLHMKLVNVARSEGSRIPEQTSHALFQLTGALRNVAGEEDIFPQFVSTGAVAELCRAMELFSSDLDVISNVSRTLSIISTHDDCCTAIINYENCFHLFVKLLQKYPGRQDIVVRLGYALGNLMAKSEIARMKLYEEEGAVSSMLNLLSIYLEKDQQMQDLEISNHLITSDAGSNGSIEDVIVKIIRIVANMSINPVVGSNLSGISPEVMHKFKEDLVSSKFHAAGSINDSPQDYKTNEYSNRFLDILLAVLRRKTLRGSEELTHSALSSLNNLSYYTSCGDSTFGDRQLEIAEVMSPVLETENKECLVEAMRVFGNLTRSQESRDFLLGNGDFSKLMKFLDSEDRELLSASAGILVNMMADWNKRVALKEDKGIERLLHILKTFCEGDWQLATLICQALWNYCIESTNLHAAFGIEETNELLGVLADYLDEERLFGVKEGSEVNDVLAASPVYQQWEEFAAVATNLLEKIDTFLDSLEPLEVLPSPVEDLPEPIGPVEMISEANINGHEE